MKIQTSVLLYLLLTATVAFAQSGKSNRNSMSLIQLDYNDSYSQAIDQLFAGSRLDARYDINNIATKRIIVNGKRAWVNSSGDYEAPDRTQQIQDFLNDKNIGLEIISYLFNRNPQSGRMNLDNIYKRGEYNASDENIRESQATKRGTDEIKEDGFTLINNSYILIYDYANIRYEYKKNSNGKEDYYWLATPAAYLFKIEWSEAYQNQLFNGWIDKNTPAHEISARKRAFDNMVVPLQFVMKKTDNTLSVSTGIEEQRKEVENGAKRKYTNDELKNQSFNQMVYLAAESLGEQIESKHQAFHITNAIYTTQPIQSKIGSKENVRVNDRYYVYEHTIQGDGTTRQRRKGVIRATTHIARNQQVASGNSGTTEFYQIAGGQLEEGMTLEEKHSLYLNLDLGYRYGKLEGGYAGLSTNLYATRATNHNAMLGVTIWKEAATVTLDYGFGLRCNNFAIYPYVGAGLDAFFKDEDEADFGKNNAWLAQGGVRFDLNLYYPLQLFGAVEYNHLLQKGEGYAEKMITKNRDINGVNAYGGLRICF